MLPMIILTDEDGDTLAINPEYIIVIEVSVEDDCESFVVCNGQDNDCTYNYHVKERIAGIVEQIIKVTSY